MMERHRDYRDGDRDRNFHHHQRRPSRFTDGPPPVDHNHSPGNYRGSFSSGRRAFDSPPRQPPAGDRGGFRPQAGGPPGGFWPIGGDVGGPDGGFGNDLPGPPRPMMPPPPSIVGQKRGFPFSGRGGSPEHFDGKSFVKLFVGSVPRTATEEEIRPLFEEQGQVLEVALIKDKRTGLQQVDGSKCRLCFVSVSFCNNFGPVDFGCNLSLSLHCQTRGCKGSRPT